MKKPDSVMYQVGLEAFYPTAYVQCRGFLMTKTILCMVCMSPHQHGRDCVWNRAKKHL